MAGDYIPHADGAFLEWSKTLITQVKAKLTYFAIPKSEFTKIETLFAGYEAAFITAQNPNRGKVDISNKNDTKKALMSILREFIKSYLAYNPKVTNDDRRRIGLPEHNSVRSSIPAPTTIPELHLDTSIIRQITIYFRDSGKKSRGKPAGVHSIEFRWAIRDTAPTSVEELEHSDTDTASPFTLVFDERDRGKTLYICPCWQNSKGEKGPRGEIVKAIIP